MDLSLAKLSLGAGSDAGASTILAKYPDSDPRLPMLQIAKGRYYRVQLTELYKMGTEPKKGRTLFLRLDRIR